MSRLIPPLLYEDGDRAGVRNVANRKFHWDREIGKVNWISE